MTKRYFKKQDNFTPRLEELNAIIPPPAEIILVGASRGGTQALIHLLSALPSHFPLPIVIVQHRLPRSSGLNLMLQNSCRLPIVEPDDKDHIKPGHIYLAPAGYHLMIDDRCFALSADDHSTGSRPSIDLLFESGAECYQNNTIGIILTGSNSDGAAGLAHIKRMGGFTVVQDPDSAAFVNMPHSAIARSPVDLILDLNGISRLLTSTVIVENRGAL